MNVLAIECSGKVAGIALYRDNFVLSEQMLDGRLTHSQIIMPMLEDCMNRAEMELSDVDVIACDVGPGSFTGIRIGCSTANALAFANGCGLVAVNSLEALAWNIAQFDGWIVPVLDARADRVYCAAYVRTEEGLLQEKIPPSGITVQELCSLLPRGTRMLFLGEGADLHRPAFGSALEECACYAPVHLSRHRPGSLAALGHDKALRGETVTMCTPLYLRASQAEQERDSKPV